MASVLARGHVYTACAARVRAARQVGRQLPCQRGLHQSAIALAKKKSKKGAKDDMFADEEDMFGFTEEDDLFSAKTKQDTHAKTTAAPMAEGAATTNGVMSTQKRLRRFNELYQFTADRIGPHPVLEKFPEQVRNTVWQQMFQLATTKEQIEAVVELFPKWRNSHRQFTPTMSNEFIRRCEELHCPTLALQVFSDRPKYGIDLTLEGARRLLHSLHVEHPLGDSVVLVALHNVYKLPPISGDLVSCAMFASACFKAGTTDSLTVAKAVLPALQTLLDGADPAAWRYPPKGTKAAVEQKEKAWLTWTLAKIEKALQKQNEPYEWLRLWRERSGQVQVAT